MPKIILDGPRDDMTQPMIDEPLAAPPSDTFKVLCVEVIPAFVGFRVTFEIVETNERFHLDYALTPPYKAAQTYQVTIG